LLLWSPRSNPAYGSRRARHMVRAGRTVNDREFFRLWPGRGQIRIPAFSAAGGTKMIAPSRGMVSDI